MLLLFTLLIHILKGHLCKIKLCAPDCRYQFYLSTWSECTNWRNVYFRQHVWQKVLLSKPCSLRGEVA